MQVGHSGRGGAEPGLGVLGIDGTVAVPQVGSEASATAKEAIRSLGAFVAFLLLVQVADLVTTFGILAAGGREGNPAAAYVLAIGGFAALAVAKFGLSAITVLSAVTLVRRGFAHMARPALSAVIFVHAFVAASNVQQLATGLF